ncbi:hypothetical protein [Desulfosporosinus sp. Sb-LF]|nr:hypothetical protein [Desulfosporosinus sp. Sb-LF]
MAIDKQKAALSSVFAAIFLTSMKIIVGIFTGALVFYPRRCIQR